MDARALEVLLAEIAQFVAIQACERVVIRTGAGASGRATQRPRDRDDLRQFHRAFDGRMARQDLLDQGRTRTRQADDEDRIGAALPPPARSRKNSAVYSSRARASRALVSSALYGTARRRSALPLA